MIQNVALYKKHCSSSLCVAYFLMFNQVTCLVQTKLPMKRTFCTLMTLLRKKLIKIVMVSNRLQIPLLAVFIKTITNLLYVVHFVPHSYRI